MNVNLFKQPKWLGITQVVIALVMLVIGIMQQRAVFQADFVSIFPESEQSQTIQDAESWFFDQYKSRAVISLQGEQVIQAYDALTQALVLKDWLDTSVQSVDVSKITEFYTRYQGALLTKTYRSLLDSPNDMGQFALAGLSETTNPFIASSINEDPSLSVANFVEERFQSSSAITIENNRLIVQQDGQKVYLVILTLPERSIEMLAAQEISQEVLLLVEQVQHQFPLLDEIHYSGIVFHTAENATQAQYEMNLFGGLSLAGLLVIVYAFFRSIKPIIGATLTIVNAVLCGFTAMIWLFPSVHILSFVFGITLIGIAIDYSFHMLAEHYTKDSTNTGKSKGTVNAIYFGFLTTALGYLTLVLSPLNILAQVAAFVVVGLFGAAIFSTTLLPMLVGGNEANKTDWQHFQRLTSWLNRWIKRRTLVFSLLIGVIGVSIMLKPMVFNDNVRLLNASSEALIHSEQKHQAYFDLENVSRFFVHSNDFESLLQSEELIKKEISLIAPEVKYAALSDWIPSKKQQEISFNLLSLAQKTGVFNQINQLFELPISFEKLTHLEEQDISEDNIQHVVNTKLYKSNHDYVSLFEIKGSIDDLTQRKIADHLLSSDKYKVIPFDKAQAISQSMALFRQELTQWGALLILAIVLIFVKVFGVKQGVISLLVLGCTIAFSLQTSLLLSGSLNLFNMLAVILILALSIDYLIFYQRKGTERSNAMAICLSAISSALVFGMLIFSKTPAVYSFGLTVMLGIFAIYLFAPFVVQESHE